MNFARLSLSLLVAGSFASGLCVQAQDLKGGKKQAPLPKCPLTELLVKIGDGGVQKAEYEVYLQKAARSSGKSKESLSEEERKAALESAIDDEILFQAAIADGALRKDYTMRKIAGEYKSRAVTSQLNPKGFSDAELEAYYKSHIAEFSRPANVQVKAVKLSDMDSKSEAKAVKEGKAKPEAYKGWIDLGWATEGQPFSGLPQETCSKIESLKKGQVEVVEDKLFKIRMLVWISDKSEAVPISFDEAKGKVRFALLNEADRSATKKLLDSLAKEYPGASEDELMLYGGVKAGVHRDLATIKPSIVNEFVSSSKSGRAELLAKLKQKFRVERLSN